MALNAWKSSLQRTGTGHGIDASGSSAQPVRINLNQIVGWLQHKIVFQAAG
jgi:hypothetical protein